MIYMAAILALATVEDIWAPIALAADVRGEYAYCLSYANEQSIVHRIDPNGNATIVANKLGWATEFGILPGQQALPNSVSSFRAEMVWLTIPEVYNQAGQRDFDLSPPLDVAFVDRYFVSRDYIRHMSGIMLDRPGNREIASVASGWKEGLCTLSYDRKGTYLDLQPRNSFKWSSYKLESSPETLSAGSRPGYFLLVDTKTSSKDSQPATAEGQLVTIELVESALGLNRTVPIGEYTFEFNGMADPFDRRGVDRSVTCFSNGKSALWINGPSLARFRCEKGKWQKQKSLTLMFGKSPVLGDLPHPYTAGLEK